VPIDLERAVLSGVAVEKRKAESFVAAQRREFKALWHKTKHLTMLRLPIPVNECCGQRPKMGQIVRLSACGLVWRAKMLALLQR
jgi:hypothetical protein